MFTRIKGEDIPHPLTYSKQFIISKTELPK